MCVTCFGFLLWCLAHSLQTYVPRDIFVYWVCNKSPSLVALFLFSFNTIERFSLTSKIVDFDTWIIILTPRNVKPILFHLIRDAMTII